MRDAHWSTASKLTSPLLEVLTAPDRDLQRLGAFWPAVQIAHEQGNLGAGRRVLILDSGFDLGLIGEERVELSPGTRSRDDQLAEHGTVVALLVRTIAPAATLELADISAVLPSGDGDREDYSVPDLELAAEILRTATAPDVVICSFGAASPARVGDYDWRYLEALDPDRDGEAFLAGLRAWAAHGFKATEPGGCGEDCELCRALTEMPADGPIVVAAAGNEQGGLECPAVHDRALACGFNAMVLESSDGGTIERNRSPTEFEQAVYLDVVLEEVPGFAGTSFAAPLIGALAALMTREEFLSATRARAAANVVHARLDYARKHPDPGGSRGEAIAAVEGAYRWLALEQGVAGHPPLGAPGHPAPCPQCTFALAGCWENWGLTYLFGGMPLEAQALLVEAATIAPRSFGLLANLAASLRVLGREERDRLARLRLLVQAAGVYRAASRWALDQGEYMGYADQVWETMLAAPVEPTIPPGPLIELPEGEGDAALLRAGHAELLAGDGAGARRSFESVAADAGPIFDDAQLGLGLAEMLAGELGEAEANLTIGAASDDFGIRYWSSYNRAVAAEIEGRLSEARAGFEGLANAESNLAYVDAARVSRALGDAAGERQAREAAISAEGAMRELGPVGWRPPCL